MKSNMMIKMMGHFYLKWCIEPLKKRGVTRDEIKAVKAEYKAVVGRAKDIGKAELIGSYLMGAFFIALNRCDGLDPDANYEVMKEGILGAKMFQKIMGDADGYFDLKRTAKRKEWSKRSHERRYENDWVVDVLDATDTYELGYNYHECGVCKLFKDEGCFEWARYLCALDFPMAEMMGMHLERTKTLAEGGDMCDFRYSRRKD